MRKGIGRTCTALVLAAWLLGGCSGPPGRQAQQAASNRTAELGLRSAMVGSLAALDRFKSRLAAGDSQGARAAFQEYQQAFAALPSRQATAADSAAVRAAIARLAEVGGVSPLTTGSGQAGTGQRLPGIAQGKTAAFTVTARENALFPARIEVEQGTRVTVFEYACRLNEHEQKGELGFLVVK